MSLYQGPCINTDCGRPEGKGHDVPKGCALTQYVWQTVEEEGIDCNFHYVDGYLFPHTVRGAAQILPGGMCTVPDSALTG